MGCIDPVPLDSGRLVDCKVGVKVFVVCKQSAGLTPLHACPGRSGWRGWSIPAVPMLLVARRRCPFAIGNYGVWFMDADARDQTGPMLWILDHLSQLIERAAMGDVDEVRYELHILCEKLETDPRLRCADSDLIAARLRHAQEKYGGYDRKPAHGQSLLISLSRDLWKRVHPPQPDTSAAPPAQAFRPSA